MAWASIGRLSKPQPTNITDGTTAAPRRGNIALAMTWCWLVVRSGDSYDNVVDSAADSLLN